MTERTAAVCPRLCRPRRSGPASPLRQQGFARARNAGTRKILPKARSNEGNRAFFIIVRIIRARGLTLTLHATP